MTVELFVSLTATGVGHGTPAAVLLGLCGERADLVDPDTIPATLEAIRARRRLSVLGRREIRFDERTDLIPHPGTLLPRHVNGMRFTASSAAGDELASRNCYSIGGGFVVGRRGGCGRRGDGLACRAAVSIQQRR